MHKLTDTDKRVMENFGWSLVDTGQKQGRSELFLTHPLLHCSANMAIPVDLEHHTLKECVATAFRSFSLNGWIRHADLTKYEEDPFISLETRVRSDAEYAREQLKTLASALGV